MDLIWRYVLAPSIAFTLDTVRDLQIVREAGSNKLPGQYIYAAVAGPVNEAPLLSLNHISANADETIKESSEKELCASFSEHVYFRKLRLKAWQDRLLVLSEFGGYSCKIPGRSFNLDKNYG